MASRPHSLHSLSGYYLTLPLQAHAWHLIQPQYPCVCVCVCAHDQTCISYVSCTGRWVLYPSFIHLHSGDVECIKKCKIHWTTRVRSKWTSSKRVVSLSRAVNVFRDHWSIMDQCTQGHKTDWSLNNQGRGTFVSDQDISRISLQFNLRSSGMKFWTILCSCLHRGFPDDSVVRKSAASGGDVGLVPGSGRSPGEGNGNPLQYSCLENPMDGKPVGLQSMGSQGVRHDRATEHHHTPHSVLSLSLCTWHPLSLCYSSQHCMLVLEIHLQLCLQRPPFLKEFIFSSLSSHPTYFTFLCAHITSNYIYICIYIYIYVLMY